jgi:pimeloyl-ACP methyl ester carboxylesterase
MPATATAPRLTQKSTTGRIFQSAAAAAVGVLDAVAPAAAQALAFDLFCTPRKRQRDPEPRVPGLPAHRFDLREDGPGLAIWDWGDGATVLLVHGWSGAAAQMSAFVEPLLGAGCYVAAPDLPAHGASEGRRSNVKEMAEAVLQVGRRVGPVHAVVAHSLGATAAIIALARGLRAERAVLLAPASDLPGYARGFARRLGLSARSADGLLARMDARVSGLDAYDPVRLAGAQTARLLVLHDPADREVPFAGGRAIAEAWPGGKLEAVPGRGHTRLLRDPDVVRRVVSFVCEDRTPLARTA